MRGGTHIFHPAPTYELEVLPWVQNIENTGILIVLALAHKRGSMQGEVSWEHLYCCPPTTSVPSPQLLQWGSHAERCLTLWSSFKMVTGTVTTPSSRALAKTACLRENQATKHTAFNFLPKGTDFICSSIKKFKPKSTVKRSSVQFSCSVVSDSLRPHGLQDARAPCPSPTPGAWSNSCPLSRWCHPKIQRDLGERQFGGDSWI